jgi:hypothetical protein
MRFPGGPPASGCGRIMKNLLHQHNQHEIHFIDGKHVNFSFKIFCEILNRISQRFCKVKLYFH